MDEEMQLELDSVADRQPVQLDQGRRDNHGRSDPKYRTPIGWLHSGRAV